MKKPSSYICVTDNLDDIISRSHNMSRDSGALRFSTIEGNKRILSIENLFTMNELSVRCLKTEKCPPVKYYYRFQRASDLNPLVQYFSWNNGTSCKLTLGDSDFENQHQQLKFLNSLEFMDTKVNLSVTENFYSESISLFVEVDNIWIGTIIDYESLNLAPIKIFGMNINKNKEDFEIFYTNPQEGQQCFETARSILRKYVLWPLKQ